MIKRINDFLAGWPMTITGGIFLIISFISNKLNLRFFFDPAWVTVIICGLPLLYLYGGSCLVILIAALLYDRNFE